MKRNLVEAYDSHGPSGRCCLESSNYLDMNNEENFYSLPYNFSPPSDRFRYTSRSILRFYRTYEHMHKSTLNLGIIMYDYIKSFKLSF